MANKHSQAARHFVDPVREPRLEPGRKHFRKTKPTEKAKPSSPRGLRRAAARQKGA